MKYKNIFQKINNTIQIFCSHCSIKLQFIAIAKIFYKMKIHNTIVTKTLCIFLKFNSTISYSYDYYGLKKKNFCMLSLGQNRSFDHPIISELVTKLLYHHNSYKATFHILFTYSHLLSYILALIVYYLTLITLPIHPTIHLSIFPLLPFPNSSLSYHLPPSLIFHATSLPVPICYCLPITIMSSSSRPDHLPLVSLCLIVIVFSSLL